MTRRNYICPEDRTVTRGYVDFSTVPTCPDCGQLMKLLWRGNVPRRDDIKAWRLLAEPARNRGSYIDGKR